MRKRKILIPFAIITLIIALVICGIVIIYRSNLPKENALTFCLPRIDGNSHWDYELSNSNILMLTESKRYSNIGCTYHYWVFEPIGSGEVTIYFQDKCMAQIVEEYSFSITYYIDKEGNIEEVSSDNKPEMTNIKDDMAGFIGIKVRDFFYYHIVKIILQIIDIFHYIL